jgi:hypothetical protein
VKNQAKQGGQLTWDSLTTGGGVVRFLANFFYFFLPSFAFSSLHLPSFAFIGEGSERGFWGDF